MRRSSEPGGVAWSTGTPTEGSAWPACTRGSRSGRSSKVGGCARRGEGGAERLGAGLLRRAQTTPDRRPTRRPRARPGTRESEYLLLHEAEALLDRVDRVYLWPGNCRAMTQAREAGAHLSTLQQQPRTGLEVSRERARGYPPRRQPRRADADRGGGRVDGRVDGAICNCCCDCCYPHRVTPAPGSGQTVAAQPLCCPPRGRAMHGLWALCPALPFRGVPGARRGAGGPRFSGSPADGRGV